MAKVHIKDRSTYYHFGGGLTPYSTSSQNFDFRGYWKIYYDNAQDIAGNRTKVIVDYYVQYALRGGLTQVGSHGTWQSLVQGSAQSISFSPNAYQWTAGLNYLGSKEWWVTHDNNGVGSFTWRGRYDMISNGNYKGTATSTYSLPTIPRATSITAFTLSDTGLNSTKVTWGTADNVDRVRYSIGGGAWVTGYSGNAKSGNFTISGLTPNTTYSIRIEVKRTDSQQLTISTAKTTTTQDIARFVSVPNNIDVDSPFEITFNRNSATTVEVGIYNTSGGGTFAPYRTVTGSSYEFDLTPTEKSNFYGDMSSNTKTYRFYIRTNGSLLATADRTFKLVNANPVFTNYNYKDTDKVLVDGNTTVGLTGSNQKLIKGISDLRVDIDPSDKAVGQKGASVSHYSLEMVGRSPRTTNWSDGYTVPMIMPEITDKTFTVTAIDSRQNSTPVITDLNTNFVNYHLPIINNYSVERKDGGISEKVELSVSGTYCDCNFGAVNNDVRVEYYYRPSGTFDWEDVNTYYNLFDPMPHNPEDEPQMLYLSESSEGSPNVNLGEIFKIGDKVKLKFSDNSEQTFSITNIIWGGLQVAETIPNKSILTMYYNSWVKGDTTITLTKSNGEYSVSGLEIKGDLGASGFTATDSFDFRLYVVDKTTALFVEFTLPKGTPNIALHKDGVAIGGAYDTGLGGFQINADTIYLNGIPLVEWEEI